MLQTKDFEQMNKKFEKDELARDLLIKDSRDVIKTSKQLIYSIHRNDMIGAEKFRKDMEIERKKFDHLAKGPLSFSGIYRAAMQEYVEAVCFYAFVKERKIPTHIGLRVDAETFLLGICDLIGELGRRAVHAVTEGNYKEALIVKGTVVSLYAELMRFDFRNSELRRKYDSVKYEVKKLEDLALELKLKGKV